MEAARVLAERRHRVTLIEKENELGGLLRYASVPDFKEELRGFLQYLKTQVKKTGVEVLLGRKASLDLLRELHPDAVVLAAGSTLSIPGIPGVERPFVAGVLDLLSGKFQPGDRVVVAGGAAMGCEVALHLASLGKKVTVAEMMGGLALDLENRSRVALLQLLKERKVDTFTNWKMEAIGDRAAFLVDGRGNKKEIPADSVILALGLTPNQELLDPLTRNFAEVRVIGDCLEPRKIYQAIHEGAFVGRTI
jgi:NADPH-dependent 2,4-dienoyl-CoA reductase/sulfur reductase-like enzyme